MSHNPAHGLVEKAQSVGCWALYYQKIPIKQWSLVCTPQQAAQHILGACLPLTKAERKNGYNAN